MPDDNDLVIMLLFVFGTLLPSPPTGINPLGSALQFWLWAILLDS